MHEGTTWRLHLGEVRGLDLSETRDAEPDLLRLVQNEEGVIALLIELRSYF